VLLPELGFIDSMKPLGTEILWPMCVGSVVLATATAWPAYHLMLYAMRRRLQRRDALREAAARADFAAAGGEASEPVVVEGAAAPDRPGGLAGSRAVTRAESHPPEGTLRP
jgi:hypothetical protein